VEFGRSLVVLRGSRHSRELIDGVSEERSLRAIEATGSNAASRDSHTTD